MHDLEQETNNDRHDEFDYVHPNVSESEDPVVGQELGI